jgi:hypothetical protein
LTITARFTNGAPPTTTPPSKTPSSRTIGDVLAQRRRLCECDVADAMAPFAGRSRRRERVGAGERHCHGAPPKEPGLDGPIIGYVGNLPTHRPAAARVARARILRGSSPSVPLMVARSCGSSRSPTSTSSE